MNQINNYQYGTLAISKAGHDKGKVYVIIDAGQEYVYLSDGIHKKIDTPKKKSMKHIQIINKIPDIFSERLNSEKKVTNEDIKRAIKIFLEQ